MKENPLSNSLEGQPSDSKRIVKIDIKDSTGKLCEFYMNLDEYERLEDWDKWGRYHPEEYYKKWNIEIPEYKSPIEVVENTGKTVREIVEECFLKMQEIQDEALKNFPKDLLTKAKEEETNTKYKWLI